MQCEPTGLLAGSTFVPLLYHTLSGLSRGFFNFFYSFGRWLRRNWLKRWASFHTVTHGGHQFPTSLITHGFPLDTLIVSQLGEFVKRFFQLFSDFSFLANRTAILLLYPLLTSLTLYHNLGDLSRGFLHFFSRTGFEPAIFPHSGREFPISLPLPLTLIVYHTHPQITR